MRLLLLPLLATLYCCTPPTPDVPSAASLTGPAAAPPVYESFEELQDLFRQDSDTTFLVNFWATWCKPCLEELPLLQELSEEHQDRPLQVILVSLDTEPGAIERIPAYLESRSIELPTVVLTDERKSWMRELDDKWNGALPTTFVYRKDLRYIYRRPFRTLQDVAAAVDPLLGQ